MKKVSKNWTNWTQRRLDNLFLRYNETYFNGALSAWSAAIVKLDARVGGLCEKTHKQVIVDTDKYESDAQIRSTLLHEMAHAASPTNSGHGYEFWAQLEQLMRKRAPVTVGFPEAPDCTMLDDVVPKEFPLCRKAMNKLQERKNRNVAKETKAKNLQTEYISDEKILHEFTSAVYEQDNLSESDIVAEIGKENGLLNIEGKPKNRWAAHIIAQGRKLYRRTKREWNQEIEIEEESWKGQ